MTTTVKVMAHCAPEKQVRISKENAAGMVGESVTIRDGETHELVVYDDLSVSVREEDRPVLTEADAAADLAGTPRPTRQQGAGLDGHFKKKPVVIQAFQMTEARRADNSEWPNWLNEAWQKDRGIEGSLYPTEEGTGNGTLSCGTLEGQHLVSWGDWIIRGVQGEIYPCKPDIFEATYSPA